MTIRSQFDFYHHKISSISSTIHQSFSLIPFTKNFKPPWLVPPHKFEKMTIDVKDLISLMAMKLLLEQDITQ